MIEPPRIRLVCATRYGQEDFFQRSPLGRALAHSYKDLSFLEMRLFFRNTSGLPLVYNAAVKEAASRPAILVFTHDDVHLVDHYWPERVAAGLRQFRLLSVAGNRRRLPNQPSWAFLDEKLTWDASENLSGAVAHGHGFPSRVQRYGMCPQECKLLDGVFLACESSTFVSSGLYFDERFDFHFYDLDICRQAELKRVSMGTYPIALIHESVGSFDSPAWKTGYAKYLEKWGN
jgi:hypothetical protein